MKTILKAVAALGLGLTISGAALAQEEHAAEATPHYPLVKPVEQNWSFAGPFGTYDKAQLQRGLKVYREACSACHSMNLVAFRSLQDLGYSEAQVKTLAAEYTINDGPNADGEMFERPGLPSDHFPAPFQNHEAAAAANNGAAPPDFSLIAKARAVERGFPQFVFDIFTQYAEGGPDYIYNLLTGYQEKAPEGITIQDGTYYNPHFISGPALAMPPPLSDGQITYDGQDITAQPTHAIMRQGIAQSPEGRRIFPRMSVHENLLMGAHGHPPSEAEATMQEVFALFPRLLERLSQRGGTLSGGEQQMLAIGRALMSRPRLLLLDEPSLGLAPLVVRHIFSAIRELNRRTGLTVLLVEQNAYQALRLAHRGYVLVNGAITMAGPGAELLARPEIRAAYLEGGH